VTESIRQQRQQTAPSEAAHRALARDYPLEESHKSYHTIVEQQTSEAEEELARPASALALSGLAAGLDLGFGPLAMAISLTLTAGELATPAQAFLSANLYSIGFIFVVLGRSALFTERTTSAVLPVLARRASIAKLFRLWGIVLAANIVGGGLFAALAVYLGPALGVVDPRTFGTLAEPLLDKSAVVTLASAIVAGWLMGLLAWLSTASRETVSQIIVIWLAALVIGLGKLHHSIAGAIEVFMAMFAGTGVTLADFGRFIVLAAVGNAIGGAFLVGCLKYGSVEQSTDRDAGLRSGTKLPVEP